MNTIFSNKYSFCLYFPYRFPKLVRPIEIIPEHPEARASGGEKDCISRFCGFCREKDRFIHALTIMIWNPLLFADFPEDFPSLSDEFGVFHFLTQDRSEVLEGISFIGSSRDETYFLVPKRAERSDETLGGSGFGIVDEGYPVLGGHRLQTMRKSGYIREILPCPLGTDLESIRHESGGEDIHRIMDSGKPRFAQ